MKKLNAKTTFDSKELLIRKMIDACEPYQKLKGKRVRLAKEVQKDLIEEGYTEKEMLKIKNLSIELNGKELNVEVQFERESIELLYQIQ